MNYAVKHEEKFSYIEEGDGEPIILLHGLFGSLSNFSHLIEYFKQHNKVVVPMLPLLDLDLLNTSVSGVAGFLKFFLEQKNYPSFHLLGNSLGGHVGLVYILKNQPRGLKSLTLTGSSGLYESGMGDSYPKRGDREYLRKKTELTFYDPAMVTEELLDEIIAITSNRLKVVRILALAKSAIRNNLGNELDGIKTPTLLIWGKNDNVTPPFVGEEFHKLIPSSELHFIDKCGHAPMMEVPDEFNIILHNFLKKLSTAATV